MSAAVTSTFDLAGLARRVATEQRSADYRDWVEPFLEEIPPEELHAALRAMATAYLRSYAARPLRPALVARSRGGRSRWANASTTYKRILAAPISLPGGAVHLGDASREQVLEAAVIRREQAASNAHAALQFERLADVMRRRKAKTVGDLSEQEVLDIFRAES